MLCIMASTSVTQSTASQHLVHIGSITFFDFLKCTLSIPTSSASHFVNFHFVNSHFVNTAILLSMQLISICLKWTSITSVYGVTITFNPQQDTSISLPAIVMGTRIFVVCMGMDQWSSLQELMSRCHGRIICIEMDYSGSSCLPCPTALALTSILKQPLNSGHSATLYS